MKKLLFLQKCNKLFDVNKTMAQWLVALLSKQTGRYRGYNFSFQKWLWKPVNCKLILTTRHCDYRCPLIHSCLKGSAPSSHSKNPTVVLPLICCWAETGFFSLPGTIFYPQNENNITQNYLEERLLLINSWL